MQAGLGMLNSECNHCFHDEMMLLTNPPKMQRYCCWCGEKSIWEKEMGGKHGPYFSGMM